MKYNKETLLKIVDSLNRTAPGNDYSIDHCNGGYRLEANGGSKIISPRLGPKALAAWMHAYRDGMETMQPRGENGEKRYNVPLYWSEMIVVATTLNMRADTIRKMVTAGELGAHNNHYAYEVAMIAKRINSQMDAITDAVEKSRAENAQ